MRSIYSADRPSSPAATARLRRPQHRRVRGALCGDPPCLLDQPRDRPTGSSSGRRMSSWCSPRRPRTSRIPAFDNCSSRPSSPRHDARWARVGRVPRRHADWAVHVAAAEDQPGAVPQYERTGPASWAAAGPPIAGRCHRRAPLSNTAGAVLDPIFSLRCRVRLAPGATAHAIFSTVVAESRDEVLDLADKYREPATFERAATLAWTRRRSSCSTSASTPRGASVPAPGQPDPVLESVAAPPPSVLARNERGATGLWPYGISGDLPIVLVRIDETGTSTRPPALLAHEYGAEGLDVDLVILNEHGATLRRGPHGALETLVRASESHSVERHRRPRAACTSCAATRCPPRTGCSSWRPRTPCS